MPLIPEWVKRARTQWRWDGTVRPPFATPPSDGQESVWDYPRPPRAEVDMREVTVCCGSVEIARSVRGVRVMETASPPTFYLPPNDVHREYLEHAGGSSMCEWKGEATYWTVTAAGARLERVGWSYPHPFPEFELIRDYYSFYPGRLECHVGPIRVAPQPGRFYGGWVTPDVVGPFKGDSGSEGW